MNDMDKLYYSWRDFDHDIITLTTQLYKDKWVPDYIVGITRGGLPLAVSLSQHLNIRCETLKVKLRDNTPGEESESNLWMAEDAFGYVPIEEQGIYKCRWDVLRRKNILVVDDINDTGATLDWLVQDWQSGCFPDEDNAWNSVWNNNVRFATLWHNTESRFDKKIDYYVHTKTGNNPWIVFPWEKVFCGIE